MAGYFEPFPRYNMLIFWSLAAIVMVVLLKEAARG
jgi:hypothetical protein